MNRKSVIRVVVFAAATVLAGSGGTKSLLAAPKDGQDGDHGRRLRVTKECSKYTGAAGSFCTISGSNVPQIPVGSIVTYDQAAGIPNGMLDSNIILDAGGGNRAIGRCTLDLQTALGCARSRRHRRLGGLSRSCEGHTAHRRRELALGRGLRLRRRLLTRATRRKGVEASLAALSVRLKPDATALLITFPRNAKDGDRVRPVWVVGGAVILHDVDRRHLMQLNQNTVIDTGKFI